MRKDCICNKMLIGYICGILTIPDQQSTLLRPRGRLTCRYLSCNSMTVFTYVCSWDPLPVSFDGFPATMAADC